MKNEETAESKKTEKNPGCIKESIKELEKDIKTSNRNFALKDIRASPKAAEAGRSLKAVHPEKKQKPAATGKSKPGAKSAESDKEELTAKMAESDKEEPTAKMAESVNKELSANLAESYNEGLSAKMAESVNKEPTAKMAESYNEELSAKLAESIQIESGKNLSINPVNTISQKEFTALIEKKLKVSAKYENPSDNREGEDNKSYRENTFSVYGGSVSRIETARYIMSVDKKKKNKEKKLSKADKGIKADTKGIEKRLQNSSHSAKTKVPGEICSVKSTGKNISKAISESSSSNETEIENKEYIELEARLKVSDRGNPNTEKKREGSSLEEKLKVEKSQRKYKTPKEKAEKFEKEAKVKNKQKYDNKSRNQKKHYKENTTNKKKNKGVIRRKTSQITEKATLISEEMKKEENPGVGLMNAFVKMAQNFGAKKVKEGVSKTIQAIMTLLSSILITLLSVLGSMLLFILCAVGILLLIIIVIITPIIIVVLAAVTIYAFIFGGLFGEDVTGDENYIVNYLNKNQASEFNAKTDTYNKKEYIVMFVNPEGPSETEYKDNTEMIIRVYLSQMYAEGKAATEDTDKMNQYIIIDTEDEKQKLQEVYNKMCYIEETGDFYMITDEETGLLTNKELILIYHLTTDEYLEKYADSISETEKQYIDDFTKYGDK